MSGHSGFGDSAVVLKQEHIFVLFTLGLTTLFFFVPQVSMAGYPMMLFATLAQELSKGVAAILMGANFETLTILTGATGVSTFSGSLSPLQSGIISLGGLLGPIAIAFICFSLCNNAIFSRFVLTVFGVLFVVAEMSVIQEPFAIIFVAMLALLLLGLSLQPNDKYAQVGLVCVSVQLCMAIFANYKELFNVSTQLSGRALPTAVATLSNQFYFPYWIWGGAFAFLSLGTLAFGLWFYIKE